MSDHDESKQSTSELIERVGRDAAVLMTRELQLAAVRHEDELKAATRNLVVVVAVAIAFASAFVLGNIALVLGLQGPLPGWQSPLVVAAAWALIGVAGAIFVGTRPGVAATLKQLATGTGPEGVSLEEARDEAQEAMRSSLGELSGAVAAETGVIVAAAILPTAGGAIEAGGKLIDAADDITDRIEESGVRGGRLVNQAFDVALLPGRLVVRVTTAAIKR